MEVVWILEAKDRIVVEGQLPWYKSVRSVVALQEFSSSTVLTVTRRKGMAVELQRVRGGKKDLLTNNQNVIVRP